MYQIVVQYLKQYLQGSGTHFLISAYQLVFYSMNQVSLPMRYFSIPLVFSVKRRINQVKESLNCNIH